MQSKHYSSLTSLHYMKFSLTTQGVLLPHSDKVVVPISAGSFRCGVCMFSSCMCRLSPDGAAFFLQSREKGIVGQLVNLNCF